MGLIDTYVMRGNEEKNLKLKSINIIDPVTGWFKIMEYNNKHVITIPNLVKTKWLTIYIWPTELTYGQGS